MNNDGFIHIDTGLYLSPKTTSLKGSPIYEKDKAVANGVASLDVNAKIPAAQIPVDGTTITVTEDGTISAAISGEVVATKADLESLQTQINSLNTEVTGMLGRMNFNARVDFSLNHGQTYTVPSKGYLWIDSITGTGGTAYINNGAIASANNQTSAAYVRAVVPVSAGDVLSASRESVQTNVLVSGFFVPQI